MPVPVYKFPSSLEAVLTFLVTWNTNSRNCHEAQAVMETLLKHEAPDSLLQYSGIKSAVESLLPYTGESRCRDGLSLRSPPVLSIFLLWLGLKRRETFAPCSGELSLL